MSPGWQHRATACDETFILVITRKVTFWIVNTYHGLPNDYF